MNRIVFVALFSALSFTAKAQAVSSIVIGSDYPWAQFTVDGQLFSGQATFTWPQGSKHIVEFIDSQGASPLGPCVVMPAKAIQFSPNGHSAISFGGWQDNAGLLVPTTDPVQTVTADPKITSLKAIVTVSYLVQLIFFTNVGEGTPTCVPPSPPNIIGAPGTLAPGEFRSGLVYFGGQPYFGNAIVFAGPNVPVNAFPYPGFVFNGWRVNGSYLSPYLTTLDIEGPTTIMPQFEPAKRVRFLTNPMGLQVLVDRAPVLTAPSLNVYETNACPSEYTRSPTPPAGIAALCYGDFDFAPYSQHIIGAPSPQTDRFGKVWVFDSWDSGGGQNTTYTTSAMTAGVDMKTANFLPGAVMSFNTVPNGLPLTIDGQSAWPTQTPSLTFTWAMGSTHQIAAAPSVTDKAGRKYTFQGWSNGGAASQSITVNQGDVTNGARIVATYSVLSRLLVQSSPAGLTLQVDGNPCQSPCAIDKPNGATIHVTAPATIPAGDGSRLDFASWSDGGASDHVYTINGDTQTLTANYRQMFSLTASSNPANGATLSFSPSAPDMYYPANQSITVTATANKGFKFRRWTGDLTGTYASGQFTISQPSTVVAQMDSVPYISPAGIQNAAGSTPDAVVAPGSIISIYGASLATDTVVGPGNPLTQTLGGIVVTVADRILPLLFVSPTQVNAQLPPDLPEGNYTLTVTPQSQANVTGTFTVARNAPGLFSWQSGTNALALAFHEDGTLITPDSPAKQGETISIYGTGFGPTQQPLLAGFLPPAGPADPLIDSLTIQLGDFQPTATFSGAATDYVGMEITKFQITADLPSGKMLPLTITINGRSSNTVQLPL